MPSTCATLWLALLLAVASEHALPRRASGVMALTILSSLANEAAFDFANTTFTVAFWGCTNVERVAHLHRETGLHADRLGLLCNPHRPHRRDL